MTCSRSEGGKAPWPAGTGSVLETGQTVDNIAFTPLTHRMAVAVEGVGHLLVGRLLGLGGGQDDPTTQRQRLRRGTRANQSRERLALFGGKLYW